MKFQRYILLFIIGFGIAIITSLFQVAPGYMDADYYFAGGLRLVDGFGFSELVLWNYLDNPVELPHPSHGYWMPLASIVAAMGIKLFSFLPEFTAAQIPFLIIVGLIPPVTAALAYSISSRQDLAILSGLLAVFSGFYLPFSTTLDTFGLYILLGALFLLLATNDSNSGRPLLRFGGLGVVAGLIHLSRADGLVWLFFAWLAVYIFPHYQAKAENKRIIINNLGSVTLGYLIIMGPWFVRNIAAFGSVIAPGGINAMWMLEYDELFTFPPDLLTIERWLSSGISSIVVARWQALGQNLQSLVAVQGLVFLFPLMIWGYWKLRNNYRVALAAWIWLGTFLIMTIVFPFPGARGGYFHSGAGVQSMFWALAPIGLKEFIEWAGKKRGWRIKQAFTVFQAGVLIMAIGLTGFLFSTKLISSEDGSSLWGIQEITYQTIDQVLEELGMGENDVIMVNNPPGFYAATRKKAIVIPNAGVDTLLLAAERFNAKYVLLEPNHPRLLNDLYNSPEDVGLLELLETLDGTHIFKIN